MSFIAASDMIRSKNTPSSMLAAQLFIVRHLLILKEMTRNLDFARKDVQPIDLDGVTGMSIIHSSSWWMLIRTMTETLASILNRTTSLLPNALLASFGMPRGDENLGDAKRACEDIIFLCSDPIYSPLRLRADRVHSHNTTQNAHPEQRPLTA
jgi:conserved oligomeric Golgi complex subunit 3